jgi:hypothetical protein
MAAMIFSIGWLQKLANDSPVNDEGLNDRHQVKASRYVRWLVSSGGAAEVSRAHSVPSFTKTSGVADDVMR